MSACLGLWLLLLLMAQDVHAEIRELAPARELELPEWVGERERGDVRGVLPPPPGIRDADDISFPAMQAFEIRRIELDGPALLEQGMIEKLVGPFVGRFSTSRDLDEIGNAITEELIRQGFVTSGARVTSVEPEYGLVHLTVVGGTITELRVETDGNFRHSRLEAAIRRETSGVLNILQVERSLQLMERAAQVSRLSAVLEPGERLGESVLSVDFEEAPRLRSEIGWANDLSPSIGSWRTTGTLEADRPLGFGERIIFEGSIGPALWQLAPRVIYPVSLFRTEIEAFARISRSEVVERPFDTLDIESEVVTVGGGVRHRAFEDLHWSINVGSSLEWRRSESFLDGFAFDFSASSDDGVSELLVLRPWIEGTWQSRRSAFVARSQLSIGTSALGGTNVDDAPADANFVSWLLQVRSSHALPFAGVRLSTRLDAQLANDSLLGLERFAIGGRDSVRGYRQNALVRDNGVSVSLEAAVPVPTPADWLMVELVGFLDGGHVWDDEARTSGFNSLLGLGGGLRLRAWDQLSVEALWASDLRELPRPFDKDIQDRGFHFRVRWAPRLP